MEPSPWQEECTFALASLYLECDDFIQISNDEYETLAAFKDTVIDAIAFERCYALVLDNYQELSEALISLAETQENQRSDYSEALAHFNLLDRRILNFCSTSRAYIDHVKQLFKSVDFDFRSFATSTFHEMYDRSPHYRIMEAFRNHAQHNKLLLSSINYSQQSSPGEAWPAALFARKSDIATNTRFKKNVLDELPENIDLGACASRHMASIGAAHIVMRAKLRKCVLRARSTIKQAISRYQNAFDLDHPVVVARLTCRTLRDKHLLSNPWEHLIDTLEVRHSKIIGLDVEDLSNSRLRL